MKPTNNIGFLLQHIAATLARQNEHILQDKLGIGFSQFKLLMVLQWQPNIRQKRIAENLGQTEASISRQIKLMFEDGLLQSVPKSEDRREHVTTLTKRGERVAAEAMQILNSYHGPMFERLSPKHQQELLDSLTVMHDYICQQGKNGSCQV